MPGCGGGSPTSRSSRTEKEVNISQAGPETLIVLPGQGVKSGGLSDGDTKA